MAITLNPLLANLGIMAPVLGPWFSQPVTLGALDPAKKLGLAVTFPANTDWFAPAATPLTPAGVFPFFGGGAALPGSNDAEDATALGLALSGTTLANGAVPMTWLRRPGGAAAQRDRLLRGLSGAVDLWAFDRRGR